jgi:hypothetical protein
MTHVWQIHHSTFVPGFCCTAVIVGAGYDLNIDDPYLYGPPTTPWGQFDLEAQGAVVDKWFGGVPNASNPAWTPNRTDTSNEDPSSPSFAGGTSDPYYHYIQDNIRAGKT